MTLSLYTPRDLIRYSVEHWERYGDRLQTWPEDSGNWFKGALIGTKHGITPQVYFEHSGIEPTRELMEQISQTDAIDIFEKKFFDDPNLDEMPWVRPMGPILDMAINAGPRRAVKILQRAINDANGPYPHKAVLDEKLKIDGWIGPITAGALEAVMSPQCFNCIHRRIQAQRERFYRLIPAANPKKKRFLQGWLNRAEDFGPDGRWVKTLPKTFPFA